jgi:hypothetical protein
MLQIMDLERLRQKLLAAARANPPADRVPYAFEKRVVARLHHQPAVDVAAAWAHGLWRAAAPCVAVALLLIVWSFVGTQNLSPSATGGEAANLAEHFEDTMLAAVTADQPAEETW